MEMSQTQIKDAIANKTAEYQAKCDKVSQNPSDSIAAMNLKEDKKIYDRDMRMLKSKLKD